MTDQEMNGLVKHLELISHDLSNDNRNASLQVLLGAESLKEMHLVIQLLKAKVGLLEYQLGGGK